MGQASNYNWLVYNLMKHSTRHLFYVPLLCNPDLPCELTAYLHNCILLSFTESAADWGKGNPFPCVYFCQCVCRNLATPTAYSAVVKGKEVFGQAFNLTDDYLSTQGFPIKTFSCYDVTSSPSPAVRDFVVVTAADKSVCYFLKRLNINKHWPLKPMLRLVAQRVLGAQTALAQPTWTGTWFNVTSGVSRIFKGGQPPWDLSHQWIVTSKI